MSEMIERVARALAKQDAYPDLPNEPAWPGWREVARAAIAAMREPTEAMRIKGRYANEMSDATATWRAMIDAALLE